VRLSLLYEKDQNMKLPEKVDYRSNKIKPLPGFYFFTI